MSNQPNCFYINENNKIIETYLDYFYSDENNELMEEYEKIVYCCIINKRSLILYQSLYHYNVWGYTDELEYEKLFIYIPYDRQDIHDFLNTQIQRYIQAKLLSIL
ncbi:hypothetical protein ACF3NV_07715 [Moraxella atlantae]|uniref:hypothetical protein n=1 Tax=Faucicola atlantae TaxID=34059 RepID=UPI00374FFE3F